jgi:asparagine synthase (glutamine-hydrolysing)
MYAFAIADGPDLFAARDPMGIKPLYLGYKDGPPGATDSCGTLYEFETRVREDIMGGLAVGYGKPDRTGIQEMLNRISHRGPGISGVFQAKRVIMAQNYLPADGAPAAGDLAIPVGTKSDGGYRICYDGQMGNWRDLANSHTISEGPLREERLVLYLYQRYGTEMLGFLDDAIFSFVISNGDELFAARDLLGIKTLFYAWKNGTLYLASEMKSILRVTQDVHEFPPGHFMDHQGSLTRFSELPGSQPEVLNSSIDVITEEIRSIIGRSLRNRVDFRLPTGSLLSGGIDSSVIALLATETYKEKFGEHARLKTFALGVGESQDIENARVIADFLDTDHHELIVGPDRILEALPEVIYYLESFDPSLVRSSVSNFLISRYALEHGIEVLLSGEGGDEVFCGYTYLKDFPVAELFTRQMECIGFLHNNASLRLDRMNQCHGVRVVAPLISGELLQYALRIPAQYKQKREGDQKIEKWIFRKAFESFLPDTIVWRIKQEFSQGSGTAAILPAYFKELISDDELAETQARYPMVRSKEELYYFRVFTEHFGENESVKTVGQWICL